MSAQLVEQVEMWEAEMARTGRYIISSVALLAKKRTTSSTEKTYPRGSIRNKRHSPKSRTSLKERSPEKEYMSAKHRQEDDKVRRNMAPPSERPPF